MKVLTGHINKETAFLQTDYPYGRLRCQRKVWVETKPGFGQRLFAQTQNPKTDRWNNPHAGGYHAIVVLYLNEESGERCGFLEHAVLSFYDGEDKIEAFAATYAEALMGETEQKILKVLRARCRVDKKITWTVETLKPGETPPDIENQSQVYRALVADEFRKAT